MKFLCLLYLFIVTNEIFGQVIKQMPTEEEWRTYFYANEKAMENKLYRLALEGKIGAYKTDSLASVYNPAEFKNRGTIEKLTRTAVGSAMMDSISYTRFSADSLQNLWFIKTIDSSPLDEMETNALRAIALTFCPYFGGFKAQEQPMCWLSVEDLKRVLGKNEYEWIKLMYYYSRNDNNVLFRETSYDDCYWDINHIKPAKVYYICDSGIYKKLSNSLHTSSFYTDDYFYELAGSSYIQPILYDHQAKKNISYYEFEVNYKQEMVVFMSTNPDDPTIGKDTMFYEPYQLNSIKNVSIDKTDHTIKSFNFEFKVSEKSDKIIRFSLDADRIRNRNTIPVLFWFFEDYFRWKK